MARKRLIYTHLFPYHIWARANNREWFYLPQETMWEIFAVKINEVIERLGLVVHEFVLMSNHYHMIAKTTESNTLGEVMCILQKSVSREVNSRTGRINHVFGGPYKASLIRDELSYAHVYKYVMQNPVRANMCNEAEKYKYTTLTQQNLSKKIKVTAPENGIDTHVIAMGEELLDWVNTPYKADTYQLLKKAIYRTEFSSLSRMNRRMFPLK